MTETARPRKAPAKKAPRPAAASVEFVESNDDPAAVREAYGLPAKDSETAPVPERQELTLHEKCANFLREEGVTPVTIEYNGDKFVFPDSLDDVSGTVLDLLSANNFVAALPLMFDPARPDEGETFSELGARQWLLFKSRKPRRPQYRELFAKWSSTSGTDTGE